ncbi:MAG: M28 family peptidase [Phycisphaerae bacterium]|nr:M28 family peptidase [Phycisphaerae bacterium]
MPIASARPLTARLCVALLLAGLAIPGIGFAQASPKTAAKAEVSAATQTTTAEASTLPRIDEVLKALPPESRLYNEHLTILASPWMEGRLPGTKGMERAMDYVEHWYRVIGLEPAAKTEESVPSFRQPFALGGRREFHDQHLSARANGAAMEFALGSDFELTGIGGTGEVTGPLAFVGYAIDNGPDGYTTFKATDDLYGKVAIMLRFEPMDDEGKSRFQKGDSAGWTRSASFQPKFNAIAAKKPAAIIVVNTPGAADPRTKSLKLAGQGLIKDIPVFSMTAEAADKLVRAAGKLAGQPDKDAGTLMDLRKLADQPPDHVLGVIDFPETLVTLGGRVEEKPVLAENTVGVLPGRGSLKDEIIVIGGHLDHLGTGEFGSRSGPGPLHPGADDNASGVAGILILADLLKKDYTNAPADQPLRTILFIAFSAEESGLNGSQHYVKHPLFPIDKHVLMFNYDMIGRMKDNRLSVSGYGSGKGMEEWVTPIFADAEQKYGLKVIASKVAMPGGSDHASFVAVGIPILFGIIADFHDDYHTPRDTGELINRESAMKAVWLFHDLAIDAAKRPARFEPDGGTGGQMRQQPLKVRLGVRSRPLGDDTGLELIEVTAGGSADKAGLVVGDRMVKFNKLPMNTREDLIEQLRAFEPGAEIQAVVIRDGKEVTLFVKLAAAE